MSTHCHNIHTCVGFVQSYFNIPILVQCADQYSFAPVGTISIRTCINLVRFTQSNTFYHCRTQAHNTLFMSKVLSDIIFRIPVAFLVPFRLLNPNRFSPSTSLIFFSTLILSTLTIIFAARALRMAVQWILYAVAFGFFFKAIILKQV